MEKEYFVIFDGRQQGPMSLQQLSALPLKEDTLVWHSELTEWTPAGQIEELADLFSPANTSGPQPAEWYAMLYGNRVGPETIETLKSMGLTPQTPVWRPGMADWVEAATISEIMRNLQGSVPPPHPGGGSRFGNPYQNQYGPDNAKQYDSNYGQTSRNGRPFWQQQTERNSGQSLPFNWLPWAIVATVAGFLTSCLGAIFGIIAIVNANKANNYYRNGDYMLAEQANSTAKVMTIIGLIIAGAGLIFGGVMWSGRLGNLSPSFLGWI